MGNDLAARRDVICRSAISRRTGDPGSLYATGPVGFRLVPAINPRDWGRSRHWASTGKRTGELPSSPSDGRGAQAGQTGLLRRPAIVPAQVEPRSRPVRSSDATTEPMGQWKSLCPLNAARRRARTPGPRAIGSTCSGDCHREIGLQPVKEQKLAECQTRRKYS